MHNRRLDGPIGINPHYRVARVFPAKHADTCTVCNKTWHTGDNITRSHGIYVHELCARAHRRITGRDPETQAIIDARTR